MRGSGGSGYALLSEDRLFRFTGRVRMSIARSVAQARRWDRFTLGTRSVKVKHDGTNSSVRQILPSIPEC